MSGGLHAYCSDRDLAIQDEVVVVIHVARALHHFVQIYALDLRGLGQLEGVFFSEVPSEVAEPRELLNQLLNFFKVFDCALAWVWNALKQLKEVLHALHLLKFSVHNLFYVSVFDQTKAKVGLKELYELLLLFQLFHQLF